MNCIKVTSNDSETSKVLLPDEVSDWIAKEFSSPYRIKRGLVFVLEVIEMVEDLPDGERVTMADGVNW